jgi:hypothetical protein
MKMELSPRQSKKRMKKAASSKVADSYVFPLKTDTLPLLQKT